jgi:hypothetical protein
MHQKFSKVLKKIMPLSNEEKKEWLRLSRSKKLREEMRALKQTGKKPPNFQAYLEWLTQINAFAGHVQKPFKKIEGRFFKL